MEKKILMLGNPELYLPSIEVRADELPAMRGLAEDLSDTLEAFRKQYKRGRAIAAPQIGVRKRAVFMDIESPVMVINPILQFPDDEMMEVLDDCMSFPGLLVRLKRHRRCLLRYRNLEWQQREVLLEDDLAELLQHEVDHLDGILSTMRAVDNKSFYMQ